MAGNHMTSVDLLRHDLGFDGVLVGVLVSDLEEIYVMWYQHHYAKDRFEAVQIAMTNTSLDMSMVPNDTSFIGYMQTLVANGQVSLDRLKASATRIVKMKLQLHLYDEHVPGADLVDQVGDWASRAAAWDMAKESLVLVKSDNKNLPLEASQGSFFFTGSSVDDIGLLCGGWTFTWQGQAGNTIFPNHWRTIQGAMMDAVNDPARTSFYQGVDVDGAWQVIEQAKAMAKDADFTVVAIGERTYPEFMGNTDPAELPTGMTNYVKELASTGTKTILILVEGRPRLLDGIANLASAVLFAGLPCEMGGEAILEMLFGKTNPSDKMALTYPKTADQVNMATPYYGRRGDQCVVKGVLSSCPVEWHFGHGLSYTSFDYTNMQLSSMAPTDQEAVLLFISVPNAPETKLLKKYTKVDLDVDQSAHVSFTLTLDDIGVHVNEIGHGLRKEATSGTYYVGLKYDTICGKYNLGPLCQSFTWSK
ncbi:Aste57867_19150 [Aphanomyces stellatus]|uniref:beta-glucosidase n=1 Tax=Aphanomyces stellatus TaxID=120398 RepID=A0A485LDK7_9STRA|nr:hypothetical protein As57867_019086 [Aphanomyces stellatus]VFT95872.1 Aste57867_19150 [Aphanomyces stellatus]